MKEKLSLAWAINAFGDKLARSRRESAARFLEEAIEVAQASGIASSDCRALVDQVFAKPSGDLRQEVGGSIVTLARLCGVHGFSIDECFEKEFARCIMMVDKIREKNKTKAVRFED